MLGHEDLLREVGATIVNQASMTLGSKIGLLFIHDAVDIVNMVPFTIRVVRDC